ncbi:hypothetical protein Tco_1313161 [Tanacetum coccineum]
MVTPLFNIMLNPPQAAESSTLPSRITSSPSPQTSSNTPSTPPSTHHSHEAEEPISLPHESLIYSAHSHRGDEGRMHPNLTSLVTNLTHRVAVLEQELKLTKQTYNKALTKLDEPVKETASDDTEVLVQEESPTKLIEDQGNGEKGEQKVSTPIVKTSTTRVPTQQVSTAPQGVSTATQEVSTPRVYAKRSASKAKDKGKAIITDETEPPKKKLKVRTQAQISMDEELARKLQEEDQARAFAEHEQERINLEAALEMQRQEVDAKSTQEHKKNAEQKSLKKEKSPEKAKGRLKRKASKPREDKVKSAKETRSSKKQKLEDDAKKAQLKECLTIVEHEVQISDAIPLGVKAPITDWGIYSLWICSLYIIDRADGSSKMYRFISDMLEVFDRQDLEDLYRLVKERHKTKKPEDEALVLLGDLKTD